MLGVVGFMVLERMFEYVGGCVVVLGYGEVDSGRGGDGSGGDSGDDGMVLV